MTRAQFKKATGCCGAALRAEAVARSAVAHQAGGIRQSCLMP